MANRFKRLSQDSDKHPLFEKLKQQKFKQDVTKIKAPVERLKVILRTMYQKLVATPTWVLPDDYTLKLMTTVQAIVEDAIKYNEMFLAKEEHEEGPELGDPSRHTPQSDDMISGLISEINKTIQKNQ